MSCDNAYDDINKANKLLNDLISKKEDIDEYEFAYPDLQFIQPDYIKAEFKKDYLNGDIELIGHYCHKTHFRLNTGEYKFMIALSKYRDSEDVNNMHNGIFVDSLVKYLFSEIVLFEDVPHIILPIKNFDASLEKLVQVNPIFKESLKDGLYSVQLTEQFNNTTSLTKYITKNYKDLTLTDWKFLIVQILYALQKIREKYPKFRHNDLSTMSVAMQPLKKYVTRNYVFPTCTLELHDMKFIAKLWNFDTCHFSDKFTNENAAKTEDNPYEDIHCIISSICKLLKKLSFDNQLVYEFFYSIVPEEIQSLSEEDYSTKISLYQTPSYIVDKNNFFAEFIIDTMAKGKKNKPIKKESPKDESSDSLTEEHVMRRGIAVRRETSTESEEVREKSPDDTIDEIEIDEEDMKEYPEEPKESKDSDTSATSEDEKEEKKVKPRKTSESSISISTPVSSLTGGNVVDSITNFFSKLSPFKKEMAQQAHTNVGAIPVPQEIDIAKLGEKLGTGVPELQQPSVQPLMPQLPPSMMSPVPQPMVPPMIPPRPDLPLIPSYAQQMQPEIPQISPIPQSMPMMPQAMPPQAIHQPFMPQYQQSMPIMIPQTGGKKQKKYKLVPKNNNFFFQ